MLERYFNGRRATTPANIKSASKSIISALVGIAIDAQTPVADAADRYLVSRSARRAPSAPITIEDLLTMRSGLESTSNRNYGAWVQSPNWVRHALAQAAVGTPGTEMIYSTGNTHLLSAILTRVTATSTWQFAQEALAKPLGFTLAPWMRDPQGDLFRRQRDGDDAAPDARLRRALPQRRAGWRTADRIAKAFIDETFKPRGRSRISEPRVRLRLVDAGDGRPADLLRVGVRRPVHRPRPEPRPRRRLDLGRHGQRRSAETSAKRSTTSSSISSSHRWQTDHRSGTCCNRSSEDQKNS